MEQRLWTREFVSKSKIVFRMLSRINCFKDKVCSSSSLAEKKDHRSTSDHLSNSSSCKENAVFARKLSWTLKKRQRRFLKHLIDENKLRSTHEMTQEQKQEIKDVLLSLNNDPRGKNSIIRSNGKVIISSLMCKTYMNLKDKDLADSHLNSHGIDLKVRYQQLLEKLEHSMSDSSPQIKDCGKISCSRGRSDSERKLFERNDVSNVPLSSGTLKEQMSHKYYEPSEEKAEILRASFPRPKELFQAVMQPAIEAGLFCHEPIAVSSHLNGFYWKAKIQLLWPRRVLVTGSHVNKEEAIKRVYLEACDQLKSFGLIAKCDESFQPVTSDMIVGLLEQISDYGDSTISNSRGKGFKIVLEKVKNDLEGSKEELCYNQMDGKVCCEWSGCHEVVSGRSRWSCCVHVGWPSPFSVQMVAPSLPSAQMLALLTAASNLKILGLLSKTNNRINPFVLQRAVLRETSSQWHRSCQSSKDLNQIHMFDNQNVDAKVFVDASMVGYGAFLTFKDSDKVNWLSESWLYHPEICHKIFGYWEQKVVLQSTIAELFALVSTVFSWKRKLQHCKLVCYSDNQTAVTLITTLQFSQLNNSSTCLNAYDSLVTTLHKTCTAYNIQLSAAWIERDHNWLADRLANGDIHVFKTAIPNAVAKKTKVKQLQLNNEFYS